jgi:hypothetical protein
MMILAATGGSRAVMSLSKSGVVLIRYTVVF